MPVRTSPPSEAELIEAERLLAIIAGDDFKVPGPDVFWWKGGWGNNGGAKVRVYNTLRRLIDLARESR